MMRHFDLDETPGRVCRTWSLLYLVVVPAHESFPCVKRQSRLGSAASELDSSPRPTFVREF